MMAKIKMVVDEQERTLEEFLNVLDKKSSVFSYTNASDAETLIRSLSQEIANKRSPSMIRIYWKENELTDTTNGKDIVSLHIFRNFTTSMIKIDKLLAKREHLIVVPDLSILELEKNNRPYIHFLSVLLRKCKAHGSTMITVVNEQEADRHVRTELLPFFDNIFILNGNRMKKKGNDKIDIRYTISDQELHLEPYMQNDMNKIKEIFSLTPEEKKELDKLVGQSLEDYRTSM
ncbi:hypothetical protein [Methanolobus profundi]|uniref:RecA-superfamily ATPase, KaiC/GvpD/RAD55 family n=1 Tax=Methanolobus profundi TaxID=487685 RepID=A0A1I4Q0T4_9EURY|nr:hypothetical protein [Methanolobus profundi]SFM33691.1 hypothetical protein SAMN04488696_1031 [Methanolobus profundi]